MYKVSSVYCITLLSVATVFFSTFFYTSIYFHIISFNVCHTYNLIMFDIIYIVLGK